MLLRTRDRAVMAAVAGGALVLALGCSSTGQHKATQAATSLQATRTELANVSTALDKAVAALNDMVDKPQADPKPQFATYKAAVTSLEAQSKAVGSSAQAMRARGEEYFKSWEQDLSGINNPELRQISADRRAKLSGHYQKVTEGYEKAKAAFDPLLTQLKDVQSVLGLDLTDNGLKMAAGPAGDAKKSAATVKQELSGVSTELDELSKVLSGAQGANK